MVRNADILFLYDAVMTNPNGDPDEENKPRMDELTRRALVSDVRLKRYLRDYWLDQGRDVWVRKLDGGETVTASERLKGLAEVYAQETGAKKPDLKKASKEFIEWLLDRLIDVRLFGATMPIGAGDATRGGMLTFTGPVQFSWGYSLHPVELMPPTITSTFAGREEGEKGEYGTMGKDWRLYYACIAFYGHISRARAKKTRLQPEDLGVLEEALLYAIPEEATTRSKIGQTPRLYLRVGYGERTPVLGDLRDYVVLKTELPGEKIRSVEDYVLDVTPLVERLLRSKQEIAGVRFWAHPDLRINGAEALKDLPGFTRI